MRALTTAFVLCSTMSLSSAAEEAPARRPDSVLPDSLDLPCFAFGAVYVHGTTSQGELLFKKVIARDDAIELFLEMYVRGNNQAKAYAMVAFYYMAPSLYDNLRELHKKRKTLVTCQSGCLRSTKSLAKLHNWIEMGRYGQEVPEKLRVREDMIQRNLPK